MRSEWKKLSSQVHAAYERYWSLDEQAREARNEAQRLERVKGCDHEPHNFYIVADGKHTQGCSQCDRLELEKLEG